MINRIYQNVISVLRFMTTEPSEWLANERSKVQRRFGAPL